MIGVIGAPNEIQPGSATAKTQLEHRLEIRRAAEAPAPREPFRLQAPPCLEGSLMARRLRPFFRRRLMISRPQRVAIRARKPCRLLRRRLCGRYVGLISLPC